MNDNKTLQSLKDVKGLSQREIEKLAQEKEKVYQELAGVISDRVPVEDLGNLAGWLTKYQQSFEQKIEFHEQFDAFPQDGAVAVYEALKEKFGFVEHRSFFGGAPMMQVPIGPNQTIQVPWGAFNLPGYDGAVVGVGTHPSKDTYHFCVSGVVKRKDKAVIDDLIERIRQKIKTSSIYKGKAISLKFTENFDPMSFSPDDVAPEFLDLSKIDQDELVLPEVVERLVQDNLFTPVEKTELCRLMGVPLRRGVLLAGTYGVGKTLTAQIQALKATRNGWTFIYLKSVKNLAEGLRVARQYAPAVLFAEDIDSVMKGEERDEEMNDILNTIDGIELKGKEVLTVLTTNHVEDINPAMIRPGRIDALIELTPPDAKAAEKLLRVYGKGLIAEDADLTEVGKLLAGQRPAMIAETVQRSKLSAITRMAVNETEFKIIGSDLVAAAHQMRHHSNLVDKKKDERTPEHIVGENFLQSVNTANRFQNGHEVRAS